LTNNLPAIIPHVTVTRAQQYDILIDDLQGIIVEGIHQARWAFIQTYHDAGTRIIQDYPDINTQEAHGKGITRRIAHDLGKSQRTIQRAVQFAQMFPDLDAAPLGKNASWHKIVNKLLPGSAEESTQPVTYYDGMAEAIDRGRYWQINLPIGAQIDLEGNTPIVHTIVKEGP